MEKRVMAFGSFDILHPGHLRYLSRAARLGDSLIVVIARDSSIKSMKGRSPVFGQNDRALLVKSLKMVDRAVIGNRISGRKDMFKIIKSYKPDVIAFGYDQKVNVPELEAWLGKNKLTAKVVRISGADNPAKHKSSIIRKHLAL